MKILLLTNTPISFKFARWLYLKDFINNIKIFGDILLVQLLINAKNDELLSQEKIFTYYVKRNNIILKLQSIVSNYYKISYCKSFLDILTKMIENERPDIVIFDSLGMACYVDLISKYSNLFKTSYIKILLQHNVEYLIILERYKKTKNIFEKIYLKPQISNVFRFEKKIMNNVDYIICLSKRDYQYFYKIYNIDQKKLKILRPITIFRQIRTPEDNFIKNDNSFIISFIGAMDWFPNVEGAEWFIKHVFTKLVNYYPNIKLYLVGKNPHKSLYKLQNLFPNNIKITGTVKDIYEYYKISNLIVIPIFSGSGIKIKVLEAMASGIPVIMTSYVAEDYEINEKDFVIANSPEEYLRNILKIINDPKFRVNISKKQLDWYNCYLKNEMDKIREFILTLNNDE